MFQVTTPTRKLLQNHDSTRWSVDQPCICTVLATLLDLKVKHRESLLLGSMTGHQTLKMLALTLKKRAAPALNWKLEKIGCGELEKWSLVIGAR